MTKNLETEVRSLWQNNRPDLTEDEVDIYFDEIFDADTTVAVKNGDRVVASGQWAEHKMTLAGATINVGLISGLTVDQRLKPAERAAKLGEVMSELHKRQHRHNMLLSIVVPTDAKQRQWLEAIGYMTATHRLAAETHALEQLTEDSRIEVDEALEWGRELWIFYAQHAGQNFFELRLNENDFFAKIARHDALGGHVLVARRHGKMVGLALALKEGKPLKNGKPSDKQFRMNFKYVLASDEQVLYRLRQKAMSLAPECKQFVMTGGCPAKGFKGAAPHAMMRVVDAEKFLKVVAERLPGLQLVVGIDSDTDIPSNNGGYRLRDGRCYTSSTLGDSIVTPGGIPAMLMAGQIVQVPFM